MVHSQRFEGLLHRCRLVSVPTVKWIAFDTPKRGFLLWLPPSTLNRQAEYFDLFLHLGNFQYKVCNLIFVAVTRQVAYLAGFFNYAPFYLEVQLPYEPVCPTVGLLEFPIGALSIIF